MVWPIHAVSNRTLRAANTRHIIVDLDVTAPLRGRDDIQGVIKLPGTCGAATIYYHGGSITAAIVLDSLVGCQFHPEKSGPVGLGIIENFVNS